jgi:hypothetical protein
MTSLGLPPPGLTDGVSGGVIIRQVTRAECRKVSRRVLRATA